MDRRQDPSATDLCKEGGCGKRTMTVAVWIVCPPSSVITSIGRVTLGATSFGGTMISTMR
jgi:hypothetical protein